MEKIVSLQNRETIGVMWQQVVAGLLLAGGTFYAFASHEVHQAFARRLFGSGAPDPGHAVHVTTGFTLLLFGMILMQPWLSSRLYGVVLVALMGALLDVLFHAAFTEPFEVWFYFVVKVALLVAVGWRLTGLAGVTSGRAAVIGGAIFAAVFSVYYRINEFYKGRPFGSRVPEIHLGPLSATYQTTPLKAALVWGAVHFLAYAIPAYFWLPVQGA